jgi:hypothetical protein
LLLYRENDIMLICITATGLTRMPSRTALVFILAIAFFAPAHADELEGDQFYRVTTVRAAAIDAGFKARSDISFYLRTLISGHHDTLAVKVK